jgi:3,4-dihydroxy 2-butanone 4-phosphate synthase/GTP cyclohydrolase II
LKRRGDFPFLKYFFEKEKLFLQERKMEKDRTVYAEVEEALEIIRAGKMIIVTDNEDRENEGDLIMAAEKVSPDAINFITAKARGLLCQAITAERAAELELPLMVRDNTSFHTTAFTVSVDAREGTTTGISTFDRDVTIKALVNPESRPDDFCKPGHIFPLVAKSGGVLERDGHTETTVDLARLAGFLPSGILCEILDDDGTMARLPRLEKMAREFGLKILTVEKLIAWRKIHDSDFSFARENGAKNCGAEKNAASSCACECANECACANAAGLGAVKNAAAAGATALAESRLPTLAGNFRLVSYENAGKPDQPNLALVSQKSFDPANALVRVHSECLTGEVLGSLRCDCAGQLARALARIADEGGVLVYLRQEGRGIGLTEKIRAYAIQDEGVDTFDANVKLGHEADERDYAAAAAILKSLGISGIRLLTNNPDKNRALVQAGIAVHEQLRIEIEPSAESRAYLAAKKDRAGHSLELV